MGRHQIVFRKTGITKRAFSALCEERLRRNSESLFGSSNCQNTTRSSVVGALLPDARFCRRGIVKCEWANVRIVDRFGFAERRTLLLATDLRGDVMNQPPHSKFHRVLCVALVVLLITAVVGAPESFVTTKDIEDAPLRLWRPHSRPMTVERVNGISTT